VESRWQTRRFRRLALPAIGFADVRSASCLRSLDIASRLLAGLQTRRRRRRV